MTLKFNLAGKSYTYTLTDASIFEEGKNVTFNANLSINNGKPVVTVGTATIEDWTEKPGGDINVDFDGEVQPGKETVVLDESFATSQGNFTIEDKQLPEGGSYVWKHDTYNDDKFMKASGYIGGAKASESWLISPTIDLNKATTATLTFDHAHKFAGTPSKELTLWITETNTEVWKQLAIDKYGTNNDYNFVTATIDLSAYAGKTIKFAFKYISTTSAAGTWEIKNVKVIANGEGGGTVTPEPDPEPGTETGNADLFISEYVEGSSFNKYIEIYNPTNEDVDLSNYKLAMHNYSGSAEGGNDGGLKEVALTGTLKAKGVIVYKNSKAEKYTGTAEAISDDVINFNGNDPVILYKGDNIIDYFGVDNTVFGVDKTFRRKATVTGPSVTYDPTQWDEYPKDTIDGLGMHTVE